MFGQGGGGGAGGGGGDDPSGKATGTGGNGGNGGNGGFGAGGGAGGKAGEGAGNAEFGASGKAGTYGGEAGEYGGGGAGLGGAVFVNENGKFYEINTEFINNTVKGGKGGNDGEEIGSNIFNRTFRDLHKPNPLDSPPSIVSITPTNGKEEQEKSGKFTITLSEPAPFDYYLGYSLSGTATSGTDYDFDTYRYVLVRQEETSAEIDIKVNEDTNFDPNETVTITLNDNTPNVEEKNKSATLSIQDNELELSISKPFQPQDIKENEKSSEFTIKLDKPESAPKKFDLYLDIMGEAVLGSFENTKAGSDYKLAWQAFNKQGEKINSEPQYIDPDNVLNSELVLKDVNSGTSTIKIIVEPIDDEIKESNKTVEFKLKDDGYIVDPQKSSATINIVDNEPTVSLGKVVHPTEGFGYGSTIEGLDEALEFNGDYFIKIPEHKSLNLSQTRSFT